MQSWSNGSGRAHCHGLWILEGSLSWLDGSGRVRTEKVCSQHKLSTKTGHPCTTYSVANYAMLFYEYFKFVDSIELPLVFPFFFFSVLFLISILKEHVRTKSTQV